MHNSIDKYPIRKVLYSLLDQYNPEDYTVKEVIDLE